MTTGLKASSDASMPGYSRLSQYYQSVVTLLPRRFFRLTVFTLCVLFTTVFLFTANHHTSSHAQQTKDRAGYHDTQINPNQQETDEPLEPFPDSPMLSSKGDGDEFSWRDEMHLPWLAAVISPAQDIDRRMIIRSTWMHMYADVPFVPRFVVSNPGSKWMDAVRFENQTYGDMIVLDHLPENSYTANTIKTLELYKWLVKSGRKYEFVSKIDTDLWFNAKGFWDRFLEPRLNSSTVSSSPASLRATVERTAIGQLFHSKNNHHVFPHGSMYTHSWDIVELLPKLHEKNPIAVSEDRAVTLLLQHGNEQANFINLNSTEKFDFDASDTRTADSPWARRASHQDAALHALSTPDVIAVHGLKDRVLFMDIANCFDKNGLKPVPELDGPERTPPKWTRWYDMLDSFGWTRHYQSEIDKVPESYYERQGSEWIVDGVWNVGLGKTGYQEL